MKKILAMMPPHLKLMGAWGQPEEHPVYLMMNLETSCPLNCDKCALPGRMRSMGISLSLREREETISHAAEIGVRALVIIGAGEPSVPDNFRRLVSPLIECAHNKGMGSVIFTTALGLDHTQAEFYRDHGTTVFVSLDSLKPEIYRKITGGGNLSRVLGNIEQLRTVYAEKEALPDGSKLLRLGINVTIQKDNVSELADLKMFAGEDMEFIVNVPMPQGKLRTYRNWEALVGDEAEKFADLSQELSDTGSHTSVAEDGVCNYFLRGIAVDSDGQLITCGYAAETAHGNIRGMTKDKLLAHYREVRTAFRVWCEWIGHTPSCPIRDSNFEKFAESICELGKRWIK